jgi:hypothetical protein
MHNGAPMSDADDRFAIIATLDCYSECLDTRNWGRLDEVFTPDVDMDFEAWHEQGLEKVTQIIRSYLDGCGPSQHLLGNYRIDLDGDRASSRCYCRVMHMGKGEHAGKTFESWIEYSDELIRTPAGWRSQRRVARAKMNQGDPSLLGPG